MDSLMLLGGQFLQAQASRERGSKGAADAFWDEVEAVEVDTLGAYYLAARLAAAFVVLGVLLAGLGLVAPPEPAAGQTACLECRAKSGRGF